jgi:hypothetical protein
MYTAIRQGKAKVGSAEELARRTNEGAVPLISSMPGFKAYYMAYADDDTVTAISVFEDQAATEECNRRIMDWIRQNLGPLLVSPPVATAGRVIVHKAG